MKTYSDLLRQFLVYLILISLTAFSCGRVDLITSAVIGVVTSDSDGSDQGSQPAPPEELGTVTPVISRSSHDSEPHYSISEDAIVFVSESGGSKDIWKVNRNGTQLTQLTTSMMSELSPVWSPDGTRIAFASDSVGNQDIWIMNSNGSGLNRLTTDTADDAYPFFSSDGTQIVFASTRSGNSDIWRIPVSGGTPTRLTTDPADDFRPRWSPSGGIIAFVSNRNGNRDIWTVPASGGVPERITEHAAEDDMPMWSPTGKYIAFTSKRSGNWDIYLKEYGRVIFPLQATLNSGIDTGPSWLSGEAGLIFISNRNGFLNIMQMLFFDLLP
ncbi:hypothetical protein ACFL6G_03325 [candidate division KSB1 bacterium]